MTERQTKETSYDIEFKVEDFHWWFAVRRKLLESFLQSIHCPSERLAIDIGCGVGSNLRVLASKGIRAVGLDHSMYALSLAKKKVELPLINGDLNQLPFRSESVGLIVAMDILEHLEGDDKGVNELYRVLEKGGIIIVTVPAFNSLWGIQDDVTGHKRRYSKRDILDKLTQGGFAVFTSSYFNFFLFFPILLGRILIRILGLKIQSENEINVPILNFLLTKIFSIEPYVLRRFPFPFGVSIFCIARKT